MKILNTAKQPQEDIFSNLVMNIENQNKSLLSHFITYEKVHLSFMSLLEIWSTGESTHRLAYRDVIKTPKKISKFVLKLHNCLNSDYFEVNKEKEKYKEVHTDTMRIYSNKVRILHKDPIFKKIKPITGDIFRKIEESGYLSSEYARKLNVSVSSYPYAYSQSYIVMYMMKKIKEMTYNEIDKSSDNIKDIVKIKQLNGKKFKSFIENTPDDNYFKIKSDVYRNLLIDSYASYYNIMNNMPSSMKSSIKSISILKKNILFESKDGYCYFNNLGKNELRYLKDNNRYLPLDTNGRRYTILNSIKKSIRNIIFKGVFEYDIESSALLMLLNTKYTNTLKSDRKNLFNEVKKHNPCIFELISDKLLTRHKIANAISGNIEDAKVLITSLIFDPNRRTKIKFKSNRDKQVKFLIDLIKEIRELSIFVNYKIFESTENEENINYKFNGIKIKDIRNIISEDIRINKYIKPKNFGKGKKYFGKKLFRFYTMMENEVRTKMIEFAKNNNTHVNQLHDCIFTEKELNVKLLMDYVYNKTGYTILFSKKEI